MALDTQVVFAKPVSHACDLLAVLVREGAVAGGKISDAHFNDLDRALGGLLGAVAAQEEFTGKEGQQLSLHTHGKVAAQRLLVLGVGKHGDPDRARDALRTAASRAVQAARPAGARALVLVWPNADPARSEKADGSDEVERDVQALAEGASLGAYSFDKYKREKKPIKLARVQILAREERSARRGGEARARAGLSAAARLGARIAEATCLARDLVNEPAGRVTPGGLAAEARDVGRESGLSIEVLNTDAEGRLVLGDVLAWAAEGEPAAIVDLATLTGAILVALGPWTAGLFANDDALAGEVQAAARAAGEPVWRMPLPPEMEELIKSPLAPPQNTGGRYGGGPPPPPPPPPPLPPAGGGGPPPPPPPRPGPGEG